MNARPPTFRNRFHIDACTHTIVYINIEVDNREVDMEGSR